MSTTDYTEVYRGLCRCGGGEIIINFCTPDHPYYTESKWFETSITCKSCVKKYQLVEQNKKYILVDKSEVDKRDEYQKEYWSRSKALMSSAHCGAILKSLIELLETQPSIAAVYRFLYAAKLVYGSLGTFRRKWKDADNWVRTQINSSNITQVMELIGTKDEVILQEINEIKRIWAKSNEPFSYVDEPICDVSHYV